MRKILLGLALVVLAVAPLAAHADTISYTLTLKQQSGSGTFAADNGLTVGSGDFTLTSTTPTPGSTTYKAIDQNNKTPVNFVEAIDFLIDTFDFNLGDASSNPGNPTHGVNSTQIQFSNNVLTQILYTGTAVIGGGVTIGFNGNGGLNYAFRDGNSTSNGSVSATLVAATPEPSSLVLFGTGVLALALASRKLFA